MGKNVQHVQHVKSNVVENGSPKLPNPSVLAEGEIAINFAEGYETLSIKSSSGNIKTFSSDEYYTEQKLGSGFTGANSAVTVTDVIVENEEIISSALTDLDERKADASAITEYWVSGTGENSVILKNSSGTASGSYAVAEGYKTSATSSNSHAEGYGTLASGYQSHAEGDSTSATSYQSHAEGSYTNASGNSSHAEGNSTKASGDYSHTEGSETTANGNNSHAEGGGTTANGSQSHAEGASTAANGNNSHAEGGGTTAIGAQSHAEGSGTIAINDSEHASGKYNVSSSASTTFGNSGNTLFSVGNGISNARHNAFEIRQNGDIYIVNKDGIDVKLQDEIGNITIDQVIDSGTSASTNAVSTSAVYGFVTSYTPSITVDQVLDNTTSASTNPVSSKAVYDVIVDNELVWTNAYVELSGTVSAHTANTEIHVTAADKEKLHTHSNKTSLDSITGNIGTMAYEDKTSYSSATDVNTALGTKLEASDVADFFDKAKYELSGTTHVINFYNGSKVKATIDADDFIKDGMISAVTLDTKSGTTYLVIEWNTDAGIQTTELNIGDLFEADNYYTKANIDDLVGSGFTSSSITDVIIENEEIVSNALTDLDERKLDASAYTPTDLSNYYTKDETSGATELITAFSTKANTATTLSGYGITDAYTKSETSGKSEISTALNLKANASDFNTHTGDTTIHFTTGTVQTQIDNSISGKVNTSDIVSAITPSNSGSTAPIATKVVAENELVMSNALIDLDERKLDASAYTPTDLSNYYTKSELTGSSTTVVVAKAASATTAASADSVALSNVSGADDLKAIEDLSGTSGLLKKTAANTWSLDTTSYSSATDVNTALAGKSDSGHTHDDRYYTESELTGSSTTVVVAKASSATTAASANAVPLSGVSSADDLKAIEDLSGTSGLLKKTAANTWSLDTTSYSSATDVNTALAGKSDTGHTHASSGVTAMTGYAKAASGSSITTSDTLNQAIGKLEAYVDDLNSQSETVATALNELNTNKLDASALTEVNSAISNLEDIVGSGYTNTTITAVIENMDEAVAAAITDLNDKIGDIESILATI